MTGGNSGINARNDGAGALGITTTGAVTGTGDYFNDGYAHHFAGISAVNRGTDLTISAAEVTGYDRGVLCPQRRHRGAEHHRHWRGGGRR